MFRRFVIAATFVVCTVSFAFSDTFIASISKVDGNKVTYKKFDFKDKDKKFDDATTEAIKDVPVTKGGFGKKKDPDKKGDPIEGGLKNEMFTKIGEKGVFASITIDDDGPNKGKITSISTFGGGGKKGKAKDKDKDK